MTMGVKDTIPAIFQIKYIGLFKTEWTCITKGSVFFYLTI